jgi:hypothetical protein
MYKEKSDIIFILNSLQFNDHVDSALWLWDSFGCYTIKSLYNFLCLGYQLTFLGQFGHLKSH